MARTLDPLQFVLMAMAGWMNQRQQQVIEYLQEENQVLREQTAALGVAQLSRAGKKLNRQSLIPDVLLANHRLAELSQFAGLEGGKCFGMSEGYRKVFTTRRAELRQSRELFRRL